MDFFSIKICSLNYRKFNKIKKEVRKMQKRATALKQNIFVKLGKFDN